VRITRLSLLAILVSLTTASTAAAQAQLYAAVGGGAQGPLYRIDPNTAAATPIGGGLGVSITGLAQNPMTGVVYGVTAVQSSSRQLVTVNTTTGVATVVAAFTGRLADITFRSDGTLFGWNEDGDDLSTINLTSGAITKVGESGIGTYGSGLAFSPSYSLFFTGEGDTGNLRVVDPNTGLTNIHKALSGGTGEGAPINALAFDPATGGLYGSLASNGGSLIRISTSTGAVTTVGSLPGGTDALAFVYTTQVPTMPGVMLLILAAMLAIGVSFMLRRTPRLA
jgi:hypothetical protein